VTTKHALAPWTKEQVTNLKHFQYSGFHPFTCPGGITLTATEQGWICGHCSYYQNWAHEFMIKYRTPLDVPEDMPR